MRRPRPPMPHVEKFLDHLSRWRGGQLWFTERLKVRSEVCFAQQTFKLARADGGSTRVHLTAHWGHDLSLLNEAITSVELAARSATVTERFAPGVSRTSTFRLLALPDDSRTGIGDAAHVWFSNTGSIRGLGGTEAAWFIDNFAVGASSLDARLHARLRRQLERAETDPMPATSSELVKALKKWRSRPIVFWVGPTLREQLAFWWACHVAASTKLKLNAWFAGPRRSELAGSVRSGLEVALDEALASMLGDAHPLSRRDIDLFASKWRAFCRGRVASNTPVVGWPTSKNWALELPRAFHVPFPRQRRGLVRPSALDEALLTPFARKAWATPLDVVCRGTDGWPLALSFLGDASLLKRLRDWAETENGRYLTSRPASGPGPKLPWSETEYRLTKDGRAILTKGLPNAAVIPAFPFGGFPAHLPAIPTR